MGLRTAILLVIGAALLAVTFLWSTGRIELPGPFAALRVVPEHGRGHPSGQFAIASSPDRGREFRDQLLTSLWQDRVITITVHVALCDATLSKVTNPNQGRPNSPRDNVYWGAKYGVETFFDNHPKWQLLDAKELRSPRYVLRRVVFSRRVKPTTRWKQRGVTKPFDICVLAFAWAGQAAGDAMRATLMDALGQRPPETVRIGSKTLQFGSGSSLVGYVGYNAVKDDSRILPDLAEPLPKPAPIGVFFISPSSAQSLGGTLQRLGLHPVLLTTGPIIPEAYILYGLTEALAAGEIEHGLTDQAADQYARFRKLDPKTARPLFVP